MPDSTDTNEAIWKSDALISHWVSTAEDRESRRTDARRLMAELLPFTDDQTFTFVDLGAGTGAAARVILDHFPGARAILADYSQQMMEQGRRELSAFGDRFTYVELDLSRRSWPTEIPGDIDAIVSSLCVHHLPDARKGELFSEILGHLTPGGWYLNYDPVATEDPVVETAWLRAGDRRDPEAAATRENRSAEEQARYENHVRYITALDAQLDLLREAGFEAIDVYWKQLDHVIYGGRRPLEDRS
jgi:tRNA (cmo5U34)-methyltransferase